jgi:hypothetical protein
MSADISKDLSAFLCPQDHCEQFDGKVQTKLDC